MNGSTDAVTGDVAHCQTFGNDALAGECSVAVHEHWQHTERQRWFDLVLPCAHHSKNNSVHSFKMAWVCSKFNINLVAGGGLVATLCTKVVLHVATSLHGFGTDMTFEFLEDLFVVLAHHIGQHVETTTVRHTKDNAVHVLIGCCRDNFVDDRNHGF